MRVVVKVLRKRQVTIPKEVADALNIREGDYLAMKVEDGRIVVERIDPLDMLKELLSARTGKGLAEEIDRERRLSERS